MTMCNYSKADNRAFVAFVPYFLNVIVEFREKYVVKLAQSALQFGDNLPT